LRFYRNDLQPGETDIIDDDLEIALCRQLRR
jgi:hypothetical protein